MHCQTELLFGLGHTIGHLHSRSSQCNEEESEHAIFWEHSRAESVNTDEGAKSQ